MMDSASADDQRFVLTIDRAGLSCALTINAGSGESPPTEMLIRAALEDHCIDPSRVEAGAVEALLRRVADEPSKEHTGVVASGVPAVHGAHAEFELCRELHDRFEEIKQRNAQLLESPTPEAAARDEGDDDEVIDFRARSAFVIVQRGDNIGKTSCESDGTDGVDVRGGVIAAKKGRSLSFKMNELLRVVDGAVIAQASGVLLHHIDRLEILPSLEIRGDVGYETGNVDFPGDVTIMGGVKDHFVVNAEDTITIHKLVEAAEIKGQGDVVLNQGMAGREMGRLDVGGDLRAGYLDGVEGEIRGNCTVAREIKECRLNVAQRVESPNSTVYGGLLEARRRIDIGVVGGPGGMLTEIAVGCIPEIQMMVDRLIKLKQALLHEIEHGDTELHALQEQTNKLTATQAERLTELQFLQITSSDMNERIVNAAARLLDAAGSWSEPNLTVHRAIYKGARIRLRCVTLVIRDMVQGPILFDLNSVGAPRCFLRGADEPTPVGEIAVIEDSGEDTDPIHLLRRVTSAAA